MTQKERRRAGDTTPQGDANFKRSAPLAPESTDPQAAASINGSSAPYGDDGIPAFLDRTAGKTREQIRAEADATTKRLSRSVVDGPVMPPKGTPSQVVPADHAEKQKEKARVCIEKMKAKKSGETAAMPLTGKAALAAIAETAKVTDPRDANASLAEHADAIRALGKRVVHDVIEIGRRLTDCKKLCGHGNWLPWLEREFGWTEQTALNFMRVRDLTDKSKEFLDLGLPVSALYLLAAPSTSEDARAEIIARAEAGEAIPVAEVKRVVRGRQPPTTTTKTKTDPVAPAPVTAAKITAPATTPGSSSSTVAAEGVVVSDLLAAIDRVMTLGAQGVAWPSTSVRKAAQRKKLFDQIRVLLIKLHELAQRRGAP